MLDPAFLRGDLEPVRARLATRGADLTTELQELAALESRRRALLPEIEGLKREQNAAAGEVARLKRQGQDAAPLVEANRQRAQQIKTLEAELEALEQRRRR